MINIDNNTFAEACYDQNTCDELIEALLNANSASATDRKTWGITKKEYRENLALALRAKIEDFIEEL